VRFADVIGHERAVARLRAAAAERTPHALLVLGPAGAGKRALADAFTARLLCAAPAGDDACGVCAHCTRLASGTHPDLHVVARDEERRDIRIEQVRELVRWLGLQPLMAARKIAIVDGAHELNEHGQNALLKTLEEPPGGSVLLLLAASASLVLPTVRSRCRLVRLDPLDDESVVRVLEARGVAAPEARGLAPLAEGAPGRALALGGDAAAATRARALGALSGLAGQDAASLSGLAQEWTRGSLDAALSTTVAWYRDVLQVRVAGDALPLRNRDAAPAIAAAAAGADPARVLRQLATVCDTIGALERNANRMLAVETMLLRLRALERGDETTA
jgi:DNA polymerase-3 subunit delta'